MTGTDMSHMARIRRLFPSHADEIQRLVFSNDAFRTLCEDYGMAIEALERLELRNHPLDLEKIIEYRTLIRELETDLQNELNVINPRAAGADRGGKLR